VDLPIAVRVVDRRIERRAVGGLLALRVVDRISGRLGAFFSQPLFEPLPFGRVSTMGVDIQWGW